MNWGRILYWIEISSCRHWSYCSFSSFFQRPVQGLALTRGIGHRLGHTVTWRAGQFFFFLWRLIYTGL